MDQNGEMNMGNLKRNYLFRFFAKVLIFLMMVQNWPLWELSHSYRWDFNKVLNNLALLKNVFTLGEAQGSVAGGFGPKKYVRTTGKPNLYIDRFPAVAGDGKITVVNGEPDGRNRISAAIIRINGERILSPKDFNQSIYTLERAVSLKEINTLEVTLRSKPEGYLTIAIVPVYSNQAPVAMDDLYVMYEGDILKVGAPGVLANDNDPERDSLSAVLVSRPFHGTLSLKPDGSFSYAPETNFSGEDSFTYQASDGVLKSNLATVTFQVIQTDHNPVAQNDTYETPEDTPLSVGAPGVLGNDNDLEGTSLTVALLNPPINGSLVLNADGSFEYTPNLNFNGPDTFTYRATNGISQSNEATVTVTVTAVNDSPVAGNDSYSTNQGTSLNVPAPGVLANDTDIESNPLTAQKVSDPLYGAIALNAEGSFTYTPNPEFNGTDSFTYRANDGSASSNVATVTIAVNAFNHLPVAQDQTVTLPEDSSIPITLTATDADGNPLTFSIVSGPSHGVLSGTPPGLIYTPSFNYFGPDSFTFRAHDGTGYSNTATISITVTPVNDPPIARPDSYAVDEDMTLNVAAPGVLSNDENADGNLLTAVLATPPANGSLTLNPNGSFVYTPFPNFYGMESFTYRASNGLLQSAPVSVTITVNPINDPPMAVPDSYSTNEDTTLTVAAPGVLGNDSDPDSPVLTASLGTGPSNGLLNLSSTGSFIYTPNSNFYGTDSFTYRAYDGSLYSNVTTVTITINSVNDPPVADAGIDQLNLTVGATVTLNGSGFDIDGDPLTYNWSFVSIPAGSSATLSNPAVANPTFGVDTPGTYVAQLIVNDGTVNSAPDTVNIVAITGNHPPVASNLSINIAGNTQATIILRGSDPDGDSLTYSVIANPSHGALSGEAPILGYTPEPNFLGPDSFTYQVDDGKGGTATATVSINSCLSSTGLVAYYPFSKNADLNANDASGNGNHGTVYGATPAADRDGYSYRAYSFNGTNNYIAIPNSSSFSFPDSFTLSAWVKNLDTPFDDDTRNHIITLNDPSNSLGLEITYRYFFMIGIGMTQYVVFSTNSFPDNNYHHVAGVYDYENSVIKLYVDGRLEGSAPANGSITIRTSRHYIGDYSASTGYYAWNGAIDEVRIYNRAISEYEIQQLYAGCSPATTTNRSPRITSMPLTSGGIGYDYSYQVIVNDPDGDPVTYSLPVAPAGMNIDQAGLIRWAPDVASDFRVSVQVRDAFGGVDTQNFWIRVGEGNSPAVNTPPIAHAGDDFTMNEGETDQLDGSHSFDAIGDRLWYTWTQVAGPVVTLDDPTAQKPRFTAPHVDRNTVLTFQLVVNDGTVDSPPAKVKVMVLNTDTWPDGSGMVVNCNLDGAGSLKAAVEYANTHPGTRITFSIPDTESCYGVNTPGVWTLPTPPRMCGAYSCGIILQGEGTIFDGTSQTENQGDRNPYGPEIEINQSGITREPFQIAASNVLVRGIVVNRSAGLTGADENITISAGENVVFSANYIGTDATGTQPIIAGSIGGGNVNQGTIGIRVVNSLPNYTYVSPIRNLRIGGSRLGEGNLFNLHSGKAIYIQYPFYTFPPHENIPGPITIQGNTFGLDRTGTRILDWVSGDVTPAIWSNAVDIEAGKDVLIGGVTAGSRNVMAGQRAQIHIDGGTGGSELGSVTVQGNYLGTDVTGSVHLNPNCGSAIAISAMGVPSPDGPEFLIGGSIPGAGNLFAECAGGNAALTGIDVYDPWANNPPVRIQGNLFGTDVTGTRDLNTTVVGTRGVRVTGGRVLIGGKEPGEGNVFGGLSGSAVEIAGDRYYAGTRQNHPPLIEVKGNLIGLSADGVTPLPNGRGISVGTNYPTIIGGMEPRAGNTIAFSREHGVYMSEGWPVQVLGNRIFDNGGLGITRGGYQTTNDPGDANYGPPSYSQNYPVINMAEVINGATLVEGVLDTPNPERCLIEVFANRVADASGFGEGEQWVAAINPNTNGTFRVTIPQDLSGKYLAATATRMTAPLNSSEFSRAILAGTSPSTNLPPLINSTPVTTVTSETPYSYQVLASDPEGGILRYALAMAPTGMAISASGLISWRPTVPQEGTQVVTVVAYDPQGLYASQNFAIQVLPLVDYLPPLVSPSLQSGLVISTPYSLSGTICDSTLAWYGIEMAPVGTNNYVLMAEGNTCVTNGILGTIDPTRLGNGLYDLRITAYDQERHLTVYDSPQPVEVKGKLKVGQFSLAFQDLSIPVSGIPINIIRSYNSFNKKQGDFGIGWDLALGTGVKLQVTRPLGTEWIAEYDYFFDPGGTGQGSWVYKLTTDKVPKVLVNYTDGKQDRFEFRPNFVSQPAFSPDWVTPAYRALEGTTSTLEDLSGTPLYLRNGQLLDLMNDDIDVYNPDTFKLTTTDGMVLILSKSTGLQSITGRNGNTITFSPNGITHSAGLSISMVRDSQGRITRITDPMGRYISYAYSGNGDLSTYTDQDGNATTWGYDTDHNLTSITDARGIQILRTQYDAEGRMIGTVDGLGNATQVTHDPANAREYVRDRRGYTAIYEYDTDGNIVAQTDPLGNTTRYTYDTNGNQLSKTDPLGNAWTWTYDASSNKLSEIDPLGNTKRWTYNARNQILTDTDAMGNVTAYTYDGNGNRTSKTDAMGNLTTYAYSATGNMLSSTDCFGTTTYAYDTTGRKTRETDPLGNVTTFTYDAAGNELTKTTTRTSDSGPVTVTTTKQYDSTGQLVRVTDPDGSVTFTEYNSLRKKSASTDKRGNRTTYEYDAAGNLTRTTYPDGTAEINAYDGNGNRVTYTDRAGRVTSFEYDAVKYGEGEQNTQNRLVRTFFPDGGSTRMEYDAAGRMAATTDENGNRTSFTYNSAGRRTAVTNALGQVTSFAYDANGNQVTMTDANGNTTTSLYDALNRQTGTIFADGTASSATYAGCGADRKTSETDQAGNTTSFGYDVLGRLIRVTDAMGGQTTYAYDEAGNKLTQTDPNGHTTRWSYDNMGRVTQRTLPLGMSETFTYNAMGNIITKTDFSGSTITYSYDANNRLTGKQYPDTSRVTHTYTPTGRKATVTDSGGVTSHTYDQRDRLLSVANPDGSTISYAYDLKGNRTRVTIPSGATNYTFDALNRLSTVTDPDGNVTGYTYDNVGNRGTVVYPNGTIAEYRYNSLNRLTYLENRKSSGEIISGYAYTLAPNGNRTRVEENNGRIVNYTYDNIYRLTQEQIIDPILGNQTFSYTYDAFGNRLTKTDAGGITTYNYNTNDQLLTEAAPGYTATYEYDPNGNTVRKTQGTVITTYAYDFENRLVASQTGDQQVEYQYDADGIRTRTASNSGTVSYLVDRNLKYAQVLEERDGSNALIVSYLHGDDLISQKRGSALSYYHYDGQMSTRRLTNSAGSATDSYVFDAFGNLIDRTGTTVNNYLYTGQQFDSNVGFYYLRARYYNPQNGRFLSHDPLLGNVFDPVSLHRYCYANANPVMFTDPSGEASFMQILVTLSVASILAGLVAIESRWYTQGVEGYRAVSKTFRMKTESGGWGEPLFYGVDDITMCQDDIFSGPVYCARYHVYKIGVGTGLTIDFGSWTRFSTGSPRSVADFGGIGGEQVFGLFELGPISCSFGEIKLPGGVIIPKTCQGLNPSGWSSPTRFGITSIVTYWRLQGKPYSTR